MVPELRRVVTLYNPRNRTAVSALAAARDAARKLGIDVAAQHVNSPEDLEERPRTLAGVDAQALFFVFAATVNTHAGLIVEAALALRLPTMVQELGAVRRGALAGYGPEYREYGRRRRPMSPAFSPAASLAISPSKPSISQSWRST
jgi:putative ABC transport system substrate-binding protein